MDFRYAVRMLAGTPGFTALAIATLALGIGINTVVFTIYDGVAFRQLPVRSPENILRLQWRSNGSTSDQFSWHEYNRLAAASNSFESLVATSSPQTVVCQFADS